MNSSAKNAFAIALGIGFGLLALALVSSSFSSPTFSGVAVGLDRTNPGSAPQPSYSAANVQNQTLARIANISQTTQTVGILVSISLVAATATSLGIAKKFRYTILKNKF